MKAHPSDAAITADPATTTMLRSFFANAEDAWNRGDADRYGDFFTEDATYVGRAGHVFSGRAAICAGHREAFAGPFRGSRLKMRPSHIRMIGDAMVIAHLDLVTLQADGTNTHAVTTVVMQRTRGGWQLQTAHTSQVA